MNRAVSFLALPAAAMLALAGCGAGEEDPLSEETSAASDGESPGPDGPLPTDGTPAEAADGTDYEACYGGSCEVVVTEGVEIAFDPEFRIGILTVTGIDGGNVSLASDFAATSTSPGGCGSVNDLGLTVGSVSGGEAIIAFYPAVDCF